MVYDRTRDSWPAKLTANWVSGTPFNPQAPLAVAAPRFESWVETKIFRVDGGTETWADELPLTLCEKLCVLMSIVLMTVVR